MTSVVGPRLSGLEQLFMKIERPNRLMYVSSVWLFDKPLDQSAVNSHIHTLVDNPDFAHFRQIPRDNESFWHTGRWVDDPTFDVQNHLKVHTLQQGTTEELQTYLGQVIGRLLDYNRPLWEVYVIYGFGDDRQKCAVFWKAHHVLADGQGFVRALLSSTSAKSQLEETIEKTVKWAKSPVYRADQLPGLSYIRNHEEIPQWFLRIYAAILMFFGYLIGTIIGLGYGISMLVKSCVFNRKSLTYEEEQPITKDIAWSETVSIDDIRIVRKAFGATLNDVMMSTVTRCIRSTLLEMDALHDKELMLFIPISKRRIDDWSFSNIVGGAWAWSPLEDLSTRQLIRAVKKEMNTVKGGVSGGFTYNWARIIYKIPGVISKEFFTNFSNKAHGVLTNVPGPMEDIFFAGERITGYYALPPQTGKGGLAIGLLSYAGKMSVSVMCDHVPQEYPDLASKITEKFVVEFSKMVDESKAAMLGGSEGKLNQ